MNTYRILFIFVLLMVTSCVTLAVPNLVFICIEGVSRDAFFSLIQKGKLPTITKMVGQGNYRKMLVSPSLDYVDRYRVLLTGFSDPEMRHTGGSFLEKLNGSIEGLNTWFVTSKHTDQMRSSLVTDLAISEAGIDHIAEDRIRSSRDIGNDVQGLIQSSPESPFAVMVTFPEPGYIGARYREGCEEYSDSIKRVDRALRGVVTYLEEHDRFDDTVFVLTTDYGFDSKTQNKNSKTWIAASFKSYHETYSSAISPSLCRVYGIGNQNVFVLQKP